MDTAGPTVGRPPHAVLAAWDLPDPGAVRAALELELAQLEPRRYADPQGVAELARAVLSTARAHGFVEAMGRARLLVADAASRTDDVVGAVETTRTILFQARAAGELTVAARAEAVLAWCLFRMGALGEALSHAVEAVRVLPLDAPPHLQVDHSMMLALLNGMQSSDDGYIAAFEQVLPVAERLDDDHLLLLTLNNLAWLHHTHGRAESAGPLVTRILAESTARGVPLTSTILDTVAAVLYDSVTSRVPSRSRGRCWDRASPRWRRALAPRRCSPWPRSGSGGEIPGRPSSSSALRRAPLRTGSCRRSSRWRASRSRNCWPPWRTTAAPTRR